MKPEFDVDKVLVEGMESLERYLDEHQAACAKLKKGFLMLTRAKMRLPEHALSEISYHEEFEASRVVTLDSKGKWRLQTALEAQAQNRSKKNGGVNLRHRRAGTGSRDEDPARADISNTGLNSDEMLWFSSLPPSDLRLAQKQFVNVLQALLIAASSAQQVQRAVHGVSTASC